MHSLDRVSVVTPRGLEQGKEKKGKNTLDFSELSWHDALFSAFFLMDLAISNETTIFPGMSGSVNFNKQKRDDFFPYSFYSTTNIIKAKKVFIMSITT